MAFEEKSGVQRFVTLSLWLNFLAFVLSVIFLGMSLIEGSSASICTGPYAALLIAACGVATVVCFIGAMTSYWTLKRKEVRLLQYIILLTCDFMILMFFGTLAGNFLG